MLTKHTLGIAVLIAPALLACGASDGDGGNTIGSGGTSPTGGTASGTGGFGSGGTSTGAGGTGAGGTGAGATGSGGVGGAVGGTGGTGGVVLEPPRKLCDISITCAGEIVDDVKTLCQFAVTDGDGLSVYSDHVGIELRGRSSIVFPKKNYSIELRTAADLENPVNLLSMGQESDWVLDGSWADRSFMRNALIFDTFRRLSEAHWAPESRFCRMSLNGEPQGIYRLVEKIKRDDDRLAVTEDDGTGSSFVIKQDSEEDGSVYFELGYQDWWKLVYPNQDRATEQQIDGVQAWFDDLNDALYGGDPGNATTGVFAYLDLQSTLDWIIVQEFSRNVDAYDLSVHFAKSAGGKAVLVPWDLDLSFGQPTIQGEPGNDSPEGWVLHRGDFIDVVGELPQIQSAIGPRWRELRQGPLSNATITAMLDSYNTTLEPGAIAANFAIWPIEDVDYDWVYEPYTLYPVSSHADEVSKLRSFIEARLTWIDQNIDNYPN